MKRVPEAERVMKEITAAASQAGSRVTHRFAGTEPSRIIDILATHLSDERRDTIRRIVSRRTTTVVPVLEGVVNSGNVSAVMRTSEALGFQQFHIISGKAPYKHSKRTTQGADKWLDLFVWEEADSCVEHLRSHGYQIVVTRPDSHSVPIESLDFTRKTAIVFGNELEGISPSLTRQADVSCFIASAGFVRSFNVSVAAAIALYTARRCFDERLNGERLNGEGDLSDEERLELTAEYYFRAVAHADRILTRSLKSGDVDSSSG